MIITRVSKSGKSVWVRRVEPVSRSTGHEAARFDGPFPIWDHEYTEEELRDAKKVSPEFMARLGKHGWASGGTPVVVGVARYYRNYSY